MADRRRHNMIFWFFLILFFLSIFILGWLFLPFFSIIILGAVVTGVFNPFFTYLKGKVNAPVASLITGILIFFILFIPIVFFVGILSKEAYDLYLLAKSAVLGDQVKNLLESSKIIEKANPILSNFNMELTGEELNKAISEIGKIIGLFLYEQARAITSNALKFFINFFFMLLRIELPEFLSN